MRACVTGGAGFIGSHLVERLVADGWAVCVLDNLGSGRRENLAAVPEVTLHVGDITDPEAARTAVAGCDVVFHLAAFASVPRSIEQPHEAIRVNIGGTQVVLDAAREAGVRRVVLAGSSSVYGDAAVLPKSEDLPLAPRSPYAASKAGAEALFHAWRRSHGLEAVILRFFNVFGPRQRHDSAYAGVIPRFLAAGIAGTPCTLEGDGGQTRDFTFVADTVDAVVRAAAVPADTAREPINVGAGRRRSMRDLIEAIEGVLGHPLATEAAPPRPGDVRDSQADITRARAVLGWAPTVELAEGLRRTAAAMRAAI